MIRRSPGFTLLELLVALAITSVLVILLVSVVSAALNVWEQGRNRIDTFANSRQVLGRLCDEIKGATAKSGQLEFAENLTSGPFTTGGTAPVARTSENIFFVASYPNIGTGDLCVIAYRHKTTTKTLERAFVESEAAWNASPGPRYTAAGYGAGSLKWKAVVERVLEFEVRSYSQGNLDNNQVPPDTWNSGGTDVAMTGNTPRYVVVRLKVVNDKTLPRLNALTPGSTPFNTLVNSTAREFMADVSLLSPH